MSPKSEEEIKDINDDWFKVFQTRRLLASLNQRFPNIEPVTNAKPIKSRKGESEPISAAKIKDILKNLKQTRDEKAVRSLDRSKGLALHEGLKKINFEVGVVKPDGNCLFRTLLQFQRNEKESADSLDDGGHESMRELIVQIVLNQNQSEEAQVSFLEYFDENLQTWSEHQ